MTAFTVLAFVLSGVWLFGTPWTVACQASLSMGLSWQKYWNRLLFSPPEDVPNPGIKPVSPSLAGGLFTAEPDSLHQMWLEKWLDLDSKKTSFPPPSPIILILYCFHNLSHVLCHVLQQQLLLNADCSWCGHCAHCPPRIYLWWKACPGPEGWHSRKQRWSVAELNKQLCVLFVFSLWTMRAHSCLAWDTDACGTGLGALETITPNGTKPSLVFFAICSLPSL